MKTLDRFLLDPEQFTRCLLPAGKDMRPFVVEACERSGLNISASEEGSSFLTIATLGIALIETRTGDVLPALRDGDAPFGITSTTYAREQGAPGELLPLPIEKIVDNPPKPYLYLGTTPNLNTRVAKPTSRDISRRTEDGIPTVCTSYPRITQAFLDAEGITDIDVVSRAGKVEVEWVRSPRNTAIVDIANTGRSALVNGVRELRPLIVPKLYEGTVLVATPSRRVEDDRRIVRFIDMLNRAAGRRSY